MMMNFKEIVEKQFDGFYLKPKKFTKNENYMQADYVELISLFSENTFVTATDIVTRFKSENISPFNNQSSSENDDELNGIKLFEKADFFDKQEFWINAIFEILETRTSTYEEKYPFVVNGNKIILKKNLTEIQMIYLILLLSSNLNHFNLFQTILTTEFESISSHAVKAILPINAIIKGFGKNSDYTGSATVKIRALAEDLNIEVREKEIENVQGNQERGLDLIAWTPFKDKIPNMLIILCQCACGKEWASKQSQTGRYNSYLDFYKSIPIHTMFIPYSLIGNSSMFDASDDLSPGILLFERKRILESLQYTDFLAGLTSKVIVEECIKNNEDIV